MSTRDKSSSGYWTMLATWLIVTAYAWLSDGFNRFVPALAAFVTGDLNKAQALPHRFVDLFPIGAAAVALMIPVSVVLGLIITGIHGAGRSHWGNKPIPRWMREPKNQFLGLMILLLGEEVYARWFFLGLLTATPWFSSNTAFYALFFIGNGTWALVHLKNYEDQNERQVLRVLPQFVSGVALTIIYVNFGLLGALLVHVAFDMILFSTDRIGVFNAAEKLIIGFNTVLAIISGFFLQKSPADMLVWLEQNRAFALPGWHFWDYFWALLLIGALSTIAAEVLLYDRVKPDMENQGGIMATFIGAIIAVGIVLGLFWFVGLFTSSLGPRLIIIALIMLMLDSRSASGSGVARIFWFSIPGVALAVCTIVAISFWAGVTLLFLHSLLEIPEKAIRAADVE